MKKYSVILALSLLVGGSFLPAVATTHSVTVSRAFPDNATRTAFIKGGKDADADIATYGYAYYTSTLKPQAQADLDQAAADGDYDSVYGFYLRGYVSR